MKKIFIAIISALFAAGLLAGCTANGTAPVSNATVDYTAPPTDATESFAPTDELIIYLPNPGHGAFLQATSYFRGRYPDVNLVIKYLGDEGNPPTDQYQTELTTELLAGSGPDVIFTDYFTSDLYKVMDSDTFLNMNSIISGDADFSMSDYNAAVISAGNYKDGQYIIPLSYTVPILLADQNGLDKVGFDLSAVPDTISFLNEINKYLPTLQTSPDFWRVFGHSTSLVTDLCDGVKKGAV